MPAIIDARLELVVDVDDGRLVIVSRLSGVGEVVVVVLLQFPLAKIPSLTFTRVTLSIKPVLFRLI